MQTFERMVVVPGPGQDGGSSRTLVRPSVPTWWGGGRGSADPQTVRAWAGRARRYAEIGTIVVRSGILRRWTTGSAPGQVALGRSLRAACERAGGMYVKLGQLLSTRPDLVSAGVAAELRLLQNAVAPVPARLVTQVVAEELGARPDRLFKDFDDRPAAAASVAQVHRATLRDGRRVAVKVQRPEVAERVRRDVDILTRLAERLERRTRWGGRPAAGQHRARIRRELDRRARLRGRGRQSHHPGSCRRAARPGRGPRARAHPDPPPRAGHGVDRRRTAGGGVGVPQTGRALSARPRPARLLPRPDLRGRHLPCGPASRERVPDPQRRHRTSRLRCDRPARPASAHGTARCAGRGRCSGRRRAGPCRHRDQRGGGRQGPGQARGLAGPPARPAPPAGRRRGRRALRCLRGRDARVRDGAGAGRVRGASVGGHPPGD
ncbi:MAG: hypothetical protein GEU96_16515, partial [Propionibacteriales bacterium]|nr:hypothetical protein [Propionibacteriales bacterium]